MRGSGRISTTARRYGSSCFHCDTRMRSVPCAMMRIPSASSLHALDHHERADFVKIGGLRVSVVRAIGTNSDARQQFFRSRECCFNGGERAWPADTEWHNCFRKQRQVLQSQHRDFKRLSRCLVLRTSSLRLAEFVAPASSRSGGWRCIFRRFRHN